MILDYSYIKEKELIYGLACIEPSKINGTLYNTRFGWCPYDNKPIELVFDGYDPVDSPHGGGERLKIWACNSCGYWQSDRISTWWNDLATLEGQHRTQKHSILRFFSIDSLDVPILALREYLNLNQSSIYKIATKKMELLVQSVFSDFFHCIVHHCGQSHDGGIDLYFIESDKPAFVQVKRRETPNKTESVSAIRDFLGAMMLKKAQKGYFVSTAEKYSLEAQNAAQKSEELGLIESYNLINCKRFFEILEIVHKDKVLPWEKYIIEYQKYVDK